MRSALMIPVAIGGWCLIGTGVLPGTRLRHKPSMLQDLELGRPMEIDTMIAIVHDFARQLAIPTPSLDTLLPLIVARAELAGCYRRAVG